MKGTLEITTVSHCKNVCSYCPQLLLIKSYGKKEYMTLETFKACIDKIPKDIYIDFSAYSECFLNPLTPEMMCYANENNYKIRLYTTLVGLTLDGLHKIKHINFNVVVPHLPDSEGHMKVKIDENYLIVAKEFIKTFPIRSPHVFGKLHPLLKSVFGHVEERPIKNSSLHTRANNVNTEKVGLTNHHFVKGKIKCGIILRENKDIMNHNVLLPNGDVTLCCMDYGLKHKIGNLLKDNYTDLFQSEEYKRIINGWNNEKEDILCRTCHEAVPL